MAIIRSCEGCEFLNKRKKSSPCIKNFKAVYDSNSGIYRRPSSCKLKHKKVNPKQELKKIKEQAIDMFQTYIRYRDDFTCCCCGTHIDKDSPDAKKLIHAGHFISRKISSLLLDEKNCFAQCRTCNYLQDKVSVNPKYIMFLIEKFGPEIFQYYYDKIYNEPKIERDLKYWIKQRDFWKAKLEEFKV